MKAMAILFLLTAPLFTAQAGEILTPQKLLAEGLAANPEIAASQARAEAERSAIRAQYSPDNPRIGYMREKNMSLMEQEMGPMNSWSVSQEIKFPTKYFLMGSAQRSRADASDQAALEKRLEVRGKLLSTYYSLYVAERIIELFEAQKETLRQVARAAESRYSTGTASQQDQMRAHVEQAKIENELIMAQQERDSMSAMLNALLNRDAFEEISLPKGDLPIPALSNSIEASIVNAPKTSNRVRASELTVTEAETNRRLARWNYAPDIMLSYRKPYTSAPEDAYAFSVELSIPLWFFARQTSEASSASARLLEAEKNHQLVVRDTSAEARSLLSRAKSSSKLLKIYETSLIPLATNTLHSAQAAYRAGKTSLIELLDSERALYETRVGFYRTLGQYVETLAKLEQAVGKSISTLPFPEGDAQ